MSESVRRSTPMVKIKILPSFVGVPFPSVLLIVAGLLNGPLWGFAAFVFHIVIKRYIYREYRRLPYPMPTGSRPMDELSELLVKGIPEEFFRRLDAACSSDASVQITCPKKYRLLKMSLNRYANRAGCYPQFREGDEIAIEETEQKPRKAGA
ncbi:hypothetical protein, partial [Klebsiella pneumoniae]|uniref:hypothetical protein n=1 Tax=Klebsiella pneumoniae TaxID=573 RepID=UPI003969A758